MTSKYDGRFSEPPYPTPVSQDDYDALAARLSKTVRLLHELGWTDDAIEREILTSDAIERVTDSASDGANP